MNSLEMRIDVTIRLPGSRTPTTVALEVDGGEFDMSPMRVAHDHAEDSRGRFEGA